MYSFTLPSNLGARRGLVVNATPRPIYTRYPLYRRLGGPQGRYVRVRKISSPPGFDPLTVQPVASRYTDCTIPAHTDIRDRQYLSIRSICKLRSSVQQLVSIKECVSSTAKATPKHKELPRHDVGSHSFQLRLPLGGDAYVRSPS